MKRTACLLLCAAFPLAAQSPFRTTRHAGLPPIYVGDKFAAGDLDGDGDVDLFVANDNSPNQLLLNDGYGQFIDATAGRFVIQPGANATHNVDLADIDGDGDLDILIGNDDNLSNRVHVNNGQGFFTDVTATAVPTNAEFTTCQVVADFDGDGDVDWFTVDGGPCHFYENNGVGVFTDASAVRLSGLPTLGGDRFDVTPHAVDVDRDGDLDVIVPDGRPYLILNQGGVLVPAPVQPPSSGYSYAFRLEDFDGDGDPDLMLAGSSRLLQNQGNGTFLDITAIAFPTPPYGGLTTCDVDGDGDIDYVTSSGLWLNNGSAVFTAVAGTTTSPRGYHAGFAAADFDGDGDVDLPGRPNFLRQTHAPSAPVRGGTYGVEFHAPAGSVVGACVALGAGPMPAGPFGLLKLDPGTAVLMAVAPIGTSAHAMSWALPNLPNLAGVNLHYQGCVLDPLAAPRITNAIRDVVQ